MTTNDKDRIVVAQWVFERQLGWIAAAEVKVGIVVALQTAMLGGLAAAFSTSTHKTPWALVFTFSSGGFAVAALSCAAMAIIPRLNGPQKSLLFFGGVAKVDGPDFTERFRSATDAELLDDWTAQIHRNAEIARDKHRWVKRAIAWAFLSAAPWLAAIALLVRA